MCTADGSVFDLLNIVPYLKKYRRHPVTGEPLAASDLIKLHFHKNGEGKYHCPVMFKPFTQHTHIVAIRPTGNVFCYEAVKELNLKVRPPSPPGICALPSGIMPHSVRIRIAPFRPVDAAAVAVQASSPRPQQQGWPALTSSHSISDASSSDADLPLP